MEIISIASGRRWVCFRKMPDLSSPNRPAGDSPGSGEGIVVVSQIGSAYVTTRRYGLADQRIVIESAPGIRGIQLWEKPADRWINKAIPGGCSSGLLFSARATPASTAMEPTTADTTVLTARRTTMFLVSLLVTLGSGTTYVRDPVLYGKHPGTTEACRSILVRFPDRLGCSWRK